LSEENDASSSTSPSPLPSASPPAVHLTPPSIATASVQTDTPAPTETTSSPPLVQQTIHASLEILDDRYSLSIPPGSTVYDLMNLAAQKQYITFETKSFGAELGYRVEEINGIASSIKNRKYWIYYINGKKATIGISSYLIHPGDIITWKYEDEE
ncbi:MAG TPA: DUF4430 domain-containing protein, partial [Candidatus Kapabacteria bacterium]|nr:DUF4430 domain-containing protein [Candidatus Kapabacteria bacterium]